MNFEDLTGLRYAVNCSILYTELDLARRFEAVRTAGFEAVELWWPFATAVPPDGDVDAFVRSVNDAGISLIGLNFFAGDMPAGDRGVVSDLARTSQFRDNIEVTISIGERLGCRAFNALYGNRVPGQDATAQDAAAVENLALAAAAADRIGGVVLVEPVSGAEHYPLRTAADVVRVLDDVTASSGQENVGLLADLYHLAVNGDDVDRVIADLHHRIAHVQIADAPGRHQPGTGQLPLADQLGALQDNGYQGWVGLEYRAEGATDDSFGWLREGTR